MVHAVEDNDNLHAHRSKMKQWARAKFSWVSVREMWLEGEQERDRVTQGDEERERERGVERIREREGRERGGQRGGERETDSDRQRQRQRQRQKWIRRVRLESVSA